ncbi:MAG: SLC13 family permease [Anaerovoracaceae bacterium]|jgi:di/tricarboxylate transporter|nr:SLC13 family permease [Anaerovoracaceae bacterium]
MNTDIIIVYIILLGAVAGFTMEKMRNDFVAIMILIALAWSGILSAEEAFSGFSSNAVIAVMGVMIIGYGIENTGLIDNLAELIIKKAGKKENRIVAIVTATTGLISSFLQNIGAVALFLPAVKKLSSESGIGPERMIMPLGFAGILGGTLTMVASGPLIVLNDLLKDGGYEPFGLFAVTPIGVGILGTGILYFYFLAGKLLPGNEKTQCELKEGSLCEIKDELLDIYNLPTELYEVDIPPGNTLVGNTIEELGIWKTYGIHILGLSDSGDITYVPWRKTRFNENQTLVIFGEKDKIENFFAAFKLEAKRELRVFKQLEDREIAGFAEIIMPPDSSLSGKTIEEIALRKNYKIEPIIYIDPEGNRLQFIEREMWPGLKAIVFGRWEALTSLKESKDFVVISEVRKPKETVRTDKKKHALGILGISIVLIIFGFPLPLCFFTGAALMVVSKVISIEELYKAIDWKTVFLLAGLIPMGIAFEKSGAAALTAQVIIGVIGSWHLILIIGVIGIIAAFFSLFMSNVAATVLLVPLIIIMAENFALDPRGLALLVAVSASNSFIIPTHQVNAYIMGPGNYKTGDFLKVGSGLTSIFLIVTTVMVYCFYI